MNELFDRYAVFIVPPLVIAGWCLMPYGLALVGGWRLLARRFRAQTPFLGRKWTRQTGSLGVFGVYTNALTIGAEQERIVHGAVGHLPFVASTAVHSLV